VTSDFDPAAFDEFEAEAWDRPGMARRYDAFLAHITDRLIEPLLDAARVGAAGRVVDIGCGPGHAAGRAAARGATVVGVDGSAEMVSHAAATVPRVLFCRADGRDLPLAASSVDAVVGNFVIFHIGEPALAIAEFGRVLAAGGRVALTRWDAPERCRLLGVLVEAVATAAGDRPSSVPDGPAFFQSDEAVAALLVSGGLADVAVERVTFTHRAADAEEVWLGLLSSTVRMAAVLQDLPRDIREQVRGVFTSRLAQYRQGDVLEIPVSVQLAHGRAP
jgi:SAM-dependent methyltransferase